jgi:uncharacterized membrane protein
MMNPSDDHPRPVSGRITQLDIVRGVAVVLMVAGHSVDAVLAPAPRLTEAFHSYELLRGLTAPLFLLLAGFAFTIATVKYWDEHTTFGVKTSRRFLRAALLLTVGYALHLPFLSFGKILFGATPDDYAQFLQADILQCVALSLATLQLTVLLTRTHARHRAVALALGIGIAAVAPFAWSTNLEGILPRAIIPYLNQQYWTLFPLIPYAAYMFLGSALGHSYLVARTRGNLQSWYRHMAFGAVILFCAGVASEIIPWKIYPGHDYWKASPGVVAMHAAVAMTVMTLFLRMRRFPLRLGRVASLLGQSSLFVYVAHLIVVYGSVANPGLASLLGRELSVGAALAVAAGVLLMMIGVTAGFRYLRGTYRIHLRIAQAGVASLLIYLFITQPY